MLICPHCQVQHSEELVWRTKTVRCGSCRQAFLCMDGTAEALPRTMQEAQAVAAKKQ